MKKIFIILLIACATNYVHAQTPDTTKKEIKEEKKSERITLRKLKGSEISYQSKQHFETRFKDAANVAWSRDSYYDIASFEMNNKSIQAYYDSEGKLVGNISPSTVTDLPAAAQKYISKHYSDYSIQKVIFFDDNEDNSTDMVLYGMQFDDSDSYFVELSSGTKQIALHVFKNGDVVFFKKLS